MGELHALTEAVTAGRWCEETARRIFTSRDYGLALAAFHGSVDAARRLQMDLLPLWQVDLHLAAQGPSRVVLSGPPRSGQPASLTLWHEIASRALLLGVLQVLTAGPARRDADECARLRAALDQAGRDLLSIAEAGADPLEPVSDSGGTLWDLVRHDARWMGARARRAAGQGETP